MHRHGIGVVSPLGVRGSDPEGIGWLITGSGTTGSGTTGSGGKGIRMREQVAAWGTADHGEPQGALAGDDSRLRNDASAALQALLNAIWTNHLETENLIGRLIALQRALDDGVPVTTALAAVTQTGTIPMLSRILVRSMNASGQARRTLVGAMRAEGASIPSIARTFGVSHQRISNILQRPGPHRHRSRPEDQERRVSTCSPSPS